MKTGLPTLTDFESDALRIDYCLADGHAYQDLHPAFNQIVQSLPEIWYQSANLSIPDAERSFSNNYAFFIKDEALNHYKDFRICPTASNSIDLIAAVLKHFNCKTVLIEPTFDNLALLVKRRGVYLEAVSDFHLYHAAERNTIEDDFQDLKHYDALFLVHPNNPTGLSLSEDAFKNIVNFCKSHKLILVIDNCFRIYRKKSFCDYKLLIESGVSFMAFEDTGKVWPTQDLKASIIYFSQDLAFIFNEIYKEVYLCVSKFSLSLISSFIHETSKVGVKKIIWDLVDCRRTLLRKAIEGSALSVPEISKQTKLPVEWLVNTCADKNDFTICKDLKGFNLAVLPGRQFYWNSQNKPQNHNNIRVSLMKPERVFEAGLRIIAHYCATLRENSSYQPMPLLSKLC